MCVCVCVYPPVKTYQPPSHLHTSEWEREHMKRMDGSVLEERDCSAGYEMEEQVWHRKEIKSRKRGEEDNCCARLLVWRTWTSNSLSNYDYFTNKFDMVIFDHKKTKKNLNKWLLVCVFVCVCLLELAVCVYSYYIWPLYTYTHIHVYENDTFLHCHICSFYCNKKELYIY